MEKLHHELWIVKIVNAIFGPVVAAVLRPFGFQPEPGHAVIPDHLGMCAVVVLVLAAIGLVVRSRLSIENPGRFQIVLEDIVSLFLNLLKSNIGEKGPRYLGLCGGIGLFIFTANMLGKFPGFMSPTANINVTLGCALTAWFYYQFQGVKEQGLLKHILHFAGYPDVPIVVGFIMFPIEVISHLSRILSLSVRLFGNIFGEEMVVLILASLIPFLVPLPMVVLGIITGTLQAFIFVMLTMIYLGGVVQTHEHAEHHDELPEAPAHVAA